MKKTTLIILSILCVSCISKRNVMDNGKTNSYKIGNVQVNSIDQTEYEAILFNGKKIINTVQDTNTSSASYYASKDKKVTAMKTLLKKSIVSNFKQRYENMKGFYGDSELGNKLLSSDSASVGQNWIYAVEYIRIDTNTNKKIIFHIESDKVEIGIVTDAEHRETAVGLMDVFTKELMNVKLKMK